jgi:hypothetical protein
MRFLVAIQSERSAHLWDSLNGRMPSNDSIHDTIDVF